METESKEVNLKRSWLLRWLGFFVLPVGFFLLMIHFFQFDGLAAVTLIPPWLWVLSAIFIVGATYSTFSRVRLVLAIVMWGAFFIFYVEEARSLFRWRDAADSERLIKVVTLNCNLGSIAAAIEVKNHHPDIVFLQESPGMSKLPEVANQLFGDDSDWISCGDASIMVRGRLRPVVTDPTSHFVHAVATTSDGSKIDVVSLRLSPPVFRLDFWNPQFWWDHQETRQVHREELEILVEHLKKHAGTDRWIVGGDFNLVGNDGALDAMDGLADSFYQAGTGWGNTGTNQFPLFRVDQIWTHGPLECRSHHTFKTEHSDHRMVVAGFQAEN